MFASISSLSLSVSCLENTFHWENGNSGQEVVGIIVEWKLVSR